MSRKSASQTKTISRLRMLVRASALLNSSLEVRKILDRLLRYTTSGLQAEGGTIYLIDHRRKQLYSERMVGRKKIEIRLGFGEGIAGHVARTGRSVRLKDVYKDRRFFRGVDEKSGFRTRSMICTPMENQEGKLVGVFQILNKKRGFFSKDDEKFLQAISIPATIAIENARLHKAEIEARLIQRDIDLASRLQRQILPESLPFIRGAQIEARTTPCRTVGGDFYDVIPLPSGEVTLAIADASGKGVGAALLVSTFQAALHTYSEFGLTLSEMAGKLNRIIYEGSTPDSFITCVLGRFDPGARTFRYVNAGHNYPVVIDGSGSVTELRAGVAPLGMMSEIGFEESECPLEHGSVLTLYTDGVTEAENRKKNLFGEERLLKTLAACCRKSPGEISDELTRVLQRFEKGASQGDDRTFIVLKVGEPLS